MSRSMDPSSERLARLVEHALERLEHEGDAGLEAFCHEHSADASAVRRKVSVLRASGLLPAKPAAPTVDGGIEPARLGEYDLIEKLGEGGMGVVYLARHRELGRRVALKVVRPEQLLFDVARQRFRREIEVVARLRHPGIVPIHAVGEERGTPYFAMELVEGSSLADVIRELEPGPGTHLTGTDAARAIARLAPPDDAQTPGSGSTYVFEGTWAETCCRLLRQTADALEHAHRKGVLHRDVKPSNLMVTLSGHVMLVDFGLAQAEGAAPLTRTGIELGSLPYLAPEQVDPARGDISARTDVYALGVTLYELLTLQLPFADRSAEVVRRRILAGQPTPLRSLNPSISWELEIVCLTAMDVEPARRYASAADFARDLENVLQRRPIDARRPSLALRARRWAQHRPALTTAFAVCGVLLPLGAVLYGVQQHRSLVALMERHRTVDGLRLAAVSSHALETDPALAVQLALAAQELAPGLVARNALYAAVARNDQRLAFRRHYGPVADARFTPDGQRVVSAGTDGTLRCIDVRAGSELWCVQAHDTAIATLHFANDATAAITASTEGSVCVWDLATGALRLRIRDRPGDLQGALLSPDGHTLVAWARDGGCRLYRVSDGAAILALHGHTGAINAVVWIEGSQELLTASADGSARLWRAADGACLVTYPHQAPVRTAAVAPSKGLVATAEVGGVARLWTRQGELLGVLTEDAQPLMQITILEFSPDGSQLLAASADHDLRIYRLSVLDASVRLAHHDRAVRSARWSPDGRRIVTGSDDRTSVVWNASTGAVLHVLAGHRARVSAASFSADGESVVTAGDDARVWRTPASRLLIPDRYHTAKMIRAYFSADGELVASGAHDGRVNLFQWRLGQRVLEFGPLPAEVSVARVGHAGAPLVVGDYQGTVRIVAPTGEIRGEIRAHTSLICSAGISSDARWLVTTATRGPAKLWSLETGQLVREYGSRDDVRAIAIFSPDDRQVVTSDGRGTLAVWDRESGECRRTLPAHRERVHGLRIDDTGQWLVSASADRTAALWDLEHGRLVARYSGHTDVVWTAALSPDRRWVATGCLDRLVRVFDATTGELHVSLAGHDDLISDVCFVNEGRDIASVTTDDGVRTWPVDAVTQARSMPRPLTLAERAEFGLGTPEVWQSAHELIERLRQECVLAAQVGSRVESEPGVDPEVREAARELASGLADSAMGLSRASWAVVTRSDQTPAAYRLALARAVESVRLAPAAVDFARGLGVAEYRAALLAEPCDQPGLERAVAVLSQPDLVQWCDQAAEPPVTRAYLALALARLGDLPRARQVHDELRADLAELRPKDEYLDGLEREVATLLAR